MHLLHLCIQILTCVSVCVFLFFGVSIFAKDLARMGYSTAVAPAVGLNDLASSAADSSGGSSS